MHEAGYLLEVIVILLASVIGVLATLRLRLGSVLGYLVAGIAIGPSGLGLIHNLGTIGALAEFGVVFLLFAIGLELPLERLKVMPLSVYALGAAQVIVTALAIAGIAVAAGVPPIASAVIGGGLALSSTAIVLQILSERGEMTSRFGRAAFAVLLVQDLAVAPFLVVVVALGQGVDAVPAALGLAALKMIVAVIVLLGAGRIVLRHVFWPVAEIRNPEIFAAMTLFVVLTTGMATQLAGMSMAFGAFMAGMLLAETTYRHQVGAVIQPFRGLLLGLFFVTVGMSIDLALALERIVLILVLLVGLILGKAAILAILAMVGGLGRAAALRLSLVLAQGGEFAFVLLGAGMIGGVLEREIGQVLLVVVGLSLLATPFLAQFGTWMAKYLEAADAVEAGEAALGSETRSGHVVIAGFGRVGSAVAARLQAADIPFVAVDQDPHRIAQARSKGLPVYYGDITRPEILDALNIETARSIVVTVNEPAITSQLVALVSYIFPDLRVYARARDDAHAAELRKMGAHIVVPELVETGFALARSLIDALGEAIPEIGKGESSDKPKDVPADKKAAS
jgi:CPA2 family monovalent cation:H+ antiporter-2